jgi:hypothetical protein
VDGFPVALHVDHRPPRERGLVERVVVDKVDLGNRAMPFVTSPDCAGLSARPTAGRAESEGRYFVGVTLVQVGSGLYAVIARAAASVPGPRSF